MADRELFDYEKPTQDGFINAAAQVVAALIAKGNYGHLTEPENLAVHVVSQARAIAEEYDALLKGKP